MIYQEEFSGYITIRCEKCGTSRRVHRVYYKRYGDEYHFNPPITCCGKSIRVVYKQKDLGTPEPEQIKCPSCGSNQITAGQRGFGTGNAVAGGILFGWVGLLGGLIGSNQVIVTCLKCGRQWNAGKY